MKMKVTDLVNGLRFLDQEALIRVLHQCHLTVRVYRPWWRRVNLFEVSDTGNVQVTGDKDAVLDWLCTPRGRCYLILFDQAIAD